MTTVRPFTFSHPLKEELERFLSLQGDLRRAKNAIQFLIGQPPLFQESGVVASALYTQALVSYVRCFTSGRRKGLTLEIFAGKPELLVKHQDIKGIRDKHVAHPVDNLERWDVLVAARGETGKAVGLGIHSWFFVSAATDELRSFLQLIMFVERWIKSRIQEVGDSLAKVVIGPRATWRSAQRAFRKEFSKEKVNGPTHREA